ncbi:MAG: hypothetical protein EOP86_15795 [Verrucomicrobiaceae bacterium]|nr:MAG: hypothetical protein EOP86_15795 [Verrucomicrobiaceae bacterium]
MKNHIALTILAGSLMLTAAQAGTQYVSGPSAPPQAPAKIDVPRVCDCFKENTAFVSIYGAGLLPDGGGRFDDSLGAGLALDYFFSTHVGIEVDGTWAATSEDVGIFTASLVLRLPIDSICLAPYIFGGGGIQASEGEGEGIAHVGAGVDWRFNNRCGIFGDGRYTWGDEQNYTLVRAGLRIAF